MDNFFYTVTPELKEKLESIKTIQNGIALFLLSPKDEVKVKWDSSINRIHHSLLVTGTSITTHSIARLLRSGGFKKNSTEARLVTGYKRSFDYAWREWYASDKRITENTFRSIISLFVKAELNSTHEKIERILEFIQSEDPIVQASLSHALVEINQPYYEGNEHLGIILPYLFLYKYGYYFRGLLDIEEYRLEKKDEYDEYKKTMQKTNNVSGMIEFYTNAILNQANKIQEKLTGKNFISEQSDLFFDITDRQKQILALFDEPGLRLTNRKVQELFGVSQITASRDLAKLAELGLLFSSGKGRSVFYTKI